MTKRWLGLSAYKDDVTYVDVQVPDDDGPVVVLADGTWKVQKGDRAEAYSFLHQQCADYIKENSIDCVVVKASAVMGKGAAKLGMLHSAEVRGIVIAAAASVCPVKQLTKGLVMRVVRPGQSPLCCSSSISAKLNDHRRHRADAVGPSRSRTPWLRMR